MPSSQYKQIRTITQSMYHAAKRPERGRQTYEFAGYIACIHCGLTLRCQGHAVTKHLYYRDTAKSRRIPCATEGDLTIRADCAREDFGDLLKRLVLPENWRESIRKQMLAEAATAGVTEENREREKERLKLKKSRTIKLYKEGYIEEEEFQGEMAAVELAIRKLEVPEVGGVSYEEVIEAGEHIPGMAALWDVATPEERREMVILLLEPGGLYYDLEHKLIAALQPLPAFLPILRMLEGVVEYDEAKGLLLTERWQDRNRRASNHRSPLSFIPCDKLCAGRDALFISASIEHLSDGPHHPHWKIPASEWPSLLHCVAQGESLRQLGKAYGVSYETVRRVIRVARHQNVAPLKTDHLRSQDTGS